MACDVLVLEDDPMILELSVELLREEGFLVSEAATTEDALRLFRRDPAQLLITDLDLSEQRTGLDVAEELRRDKPDLAIIFLTGRVDLMENRLPGGRQRLLRKPFKPDKLTALVWELLEDR